VSDGAKPPGDEPPVAPAERGKGALPKLPVRASIYIDPDGSVHFGALFEGLVPVAEALSGKPSRAAVTVVPGESVAGVDGGAPASPAPSAAATPERAK
jgi:hypothetical protein